MPSEESISSESANVDLKNRFIACSQYIARQQHFYKLLKDMEKDESLKSIREEFKELLGTFNRCYMESKRKTYKIRELVALNAIKDQKVKDIGFYDEETERDLRAVNSNLQTLLDAVTEQRNKLQEKVKFVRKEDKIIQVDIEWIRHSPTDESKRKLDKAPSKTGLIYCNRDDLKLRGSKKENESSVLKANLKVVVADLKLTRKEISDLTKEIEEKDIVIKEYSKDLSESEIRLTEIQKKILDIQKPFEISIRTYETELECKKQKYHEVNRNLQQANGLNTKLVEENELKDCIITNLQTRLEKSIFEMDSSVRKTDLFEEYLATSQVQNEASKRKIKTLQEEVEKLKKEVFLKEFVKSSPFSRIGKEFYEATLETRIVGYKKQIAVRDDRLYRVQKEVNAMVLVLQSVRADLNSAVLEKSYYESEIPRLKHVCKETSSDLKFFKEKLHNTKKEAADLRKDLKIQTLKYQQAMEKKNKFHSMCTHLKLVNSQQKKENLGLAKRQVYLLKILSDQDAEMKKIVNFKRYVC